MSISSSIYIPPSTEDKDLELYLKKSSAQSSFFTRQLTSSNVSISNQLTVGKIGSSANIPSAATGTGIGTSGTVSVAVLSNLFYGSLTITTGTSPSSAGNTIAIITLPSSFTSSSSYLVYITAKDANASSVQWYATPTSTTQFSLKASATLSSSTVYTVNYIIVGT